MTDGLRIAVIGSRGIPAHYGGFETFAEELAPRLVTRGHEVTVYGRRGYTGEEAREQWRGVRLVHTPYLKVRALETLSHEFTSIVHSLMKPFDLYYFLGTRGAPWYLLTKPTSRVAVVHTDGLEWQRRKWGTAGRAYLRWAEWLAASVSADELVTDAQAMRAYYLDRYGRDSKQIPYGAPLLADVDAEALRRDWGLEPGGYDLVVCRLEPENNVDLIVREHLLSATASPLVIVGDAPYEGAYHRALHELAAHDRVRFLGAVHDGVDTLYAGCRAYLHGHEVGGLNPSLLRAMGAGRACLALDTPFNREALGEGALAQLWSRDPGSLGERLAALDADPDLVIAQGQGNRVRAEQAFSWEQVADTHDRFFREVGTRRKG